MYQKNNVDYIFRLICLITFSVIIILTDNIYTLAILSIFVFFFINVLKNFFVSIILLINFIGFIVGYATGSLILFKISLMIIYIYYFLYNYETDLKDEQKNQDIYKKIFVRNENKISQKFKKGEVIDKEIIKDKSDSDYNDISFNYQFRFKNNNKKKNIAIFDVWYVVFHLTFLFISIMIGSCVI